MIKLDADLLAKLGLEGLPTWERDLFLAHINETLEMRVGVKLADGFSNQQLDEFETFFENKDEAGAFKWLEAEVPDYKKIVAAEFDILKEELSEQSSVILEISRRGQLNTKLAVGDIADDEEEKLEDPQSPSAFASGHQGIGRRGSIGGR